MDDERIRRRGRWARRLDTSLLPFMGPAQIGAGHPEEPVAGSEDAPCPLCGVSMRLHRIERSGNQSQATRLHCP